MGDEICFLPLPPSEVAAREQGVDLTEVSGRPTGGNGPRLVW